MTYRSESDAEIHLATGVDVFGFHRLIVAHAFSTPSRAPNLTLLRSMMQWM